MEKWEEDLQKAIDQQPIIIIKKQRRGNGGLLTMVFILILAMVSVYAYKKISGFKQWVSGHFHLEKIQKATNDILDGSQRDDGLIERIGKIEDELKKNSRKIGVLGITSNENFSIIGADSGKDLIMLNHDWTMSRTPKNLKIDGEDKDFIDNNSKQPD